MALDVGIDVGSSLIRAQGETWLRMENAAPCWFLHPLFEKLRAQTGQYIDLHGNATFADEQLAALKKDVGKKMLAGRCAWPRHSLTAGRFRSASSWRRSAGICASRWIVGRSWT